MNEHHLLIQTWAMLRDVSWQEAFGAWLDMWIETLNDWADWVMGVDYE